MHYRGDVYVELFLQLGGVGAPKLAGRAETGVVDQNPHAGRQALRNFRAALGIGEVRGQYFNGAGFGFQLAGQLLEPFAVTSNQDQVVTVAGVATRISATDAGRGPSDQRNGSGHVLSVVVVAGLMAVASRSRRTSNAFRSAFLTRDRLGRATGRIRQHPGGGFRLSTPLRQLGASGRR